MGIDDIITVTVVQQHRLRWYQYVHVVKMDANDWAKKCMDY